MFPLIETVTTTMPHIQTDRPPIGVPNNYCY